MASALSDLVDILLKKFIKLNVYTVMIMKNVKLSIKIVSVILNIQMLKIIY